VSIGVWLVLTTFAGFLVGIVAGFIAPLGDNTTQEQINNLTTQRNLSLISPSQLFTEATKATLNPAIQSFDINALIRVANEPQAYPLSQLSLEQSLLVVWPQFVGLIALTTGAFAIAYVSFMRQEVRA
jgi:ABC-2 type transport system permease protein